MTNIILDFAVRRAGGASRAHAPRFARGASLLDWTSSHCANVLRAGFRFWILKALPVGSFRNSNVASLNPNGIRSDFRRAAFLENQQHHYKTRPVRSGRVEGGFDYKVCFINSPNWVMRSEDVAPA